MNLPNVTLADFLAVVGVVALSYSFLWISFTSYVRMKNEFRRNKLNAKYNDDTNK